MQKECFEIAGAYHVKVACIYRRARGGQRHNCRSLNRLCIVRPSEIPQDRINSRASVAAPRTARSDYGTTVMVDTLGQGIAHRLLAARVTIGYHPYPSIPREVDDYEIIGLPARDTVIRIHYRCSIGCNQIVNQDF